MGLEHELVICLSVSLLLGTGGVRMDDNGIYRLRRARGR